MSEFLRPGSKGQATKVAKVLRAWAADLKHTVEGLEAAARLYEEGGNIQQTIGYAEGAVHLFRMVLNSMISKRLV